MSATETLKRIVKNGKVHVLGKIYLSKELKQLEGEIVYVSFETSACDKLIVKRSDGTFVCEVYGYTKIDRNPSPYRPFYG